MQKKNLAGLKFNRLQVIEESGRNASKSVMWLCQCDCGNTKTVSTGNLINGSVKSCGCLRAETSRITGSRAQKLSTIGMNYCGGCKSEKPIGEFYRSSKYLDKLDYSCKECNKRASRKSRLKKLIEDPDYFNKYARDWRKKNPELSKSIRSRGQQKYRYTQYGLTKEKFEETLLEQDGKCAICCSTPTDNVWHVDHNKVLGKLVGRRGILCRACNTGIGLFLHDPQLLENAIHYLELWNLLQGTTPKTRKV